MLFAGELSFNLSSRPLKNSELNQAKERGFNFKQVPIAIGRIAFCLNPQVSVSSFSLSKIKDIFTGKVANKESIRWT